MGELCGGAKVAVAVSGGVDSTVLLRSLHQLGREVVALHVDHGLRADAEADAVFVLELADALEVPAERLRVRVGAGNRQHEARMARYAALADAAQRHGCSAVATGHTATDQAETVLMHLIRGSGLRGLAGMTARRPLRGRVEVVRPLLWATREEVEAEADRQGWSWSEDPSNAADAYQRNRIRHHVLPLLEEEGGPEVAKRIAASAAAARAALPDLAHYGDPMDQSLDLDRLRAVPEPWRAAIWAEALAAWAPEVPRNHDVLRQLEALLEAQPGRRVPLDRLVAWRDRDAVRFVAPAPGVETAVEIGQPVRTPFGSLHLRMLTLGRSDGAVPVERRSAQDGPNAVMLDWSALGGNLTLRTWRSGDRIEPRGLRGSKLVSDVLTDRRVPPSQRDRQLVLCADDRIAWVVGHRGAAWAEATDQTRRVVWATYEPRESVGREHPDP